MRSGGIPPRQNGLYSQVFPGRRRNKERTGCRQIPLYTNLIDQQFRFPPFFACSPFLCIALCILARLSSVVSCSLLQRELHLVELNLCRNMHTEGCNTLKYFETTQGTLTVQFFILSLSFQMKPNLKVLKQLGLFLMA